MIKSSAGYLPCPVCVPWSKRPDYVPKKLISNTDLNLKEYNTSEDDLNGSRKKERKPTVMTEERRLAIKQAMQNRGPLDREHRRKISNAVRERYATDPSLRQKGRRKKCGYCGEEGHNRKTCPHLSSSTTVASVSNQKTVQDGSNTKRKPPRCSICGRVGHRKTSCPTLTKSEEETKPPVDVIFQNEKTTMSPLSQGPLLNVHESDARTTSVEDSKRRVLSQWPLRSLRGNEVAVSNDGSILFPLPAHQDQCVEQAAIAVQRAWEDGIRRQNLELLIPQENAAIDGGWPGGIKQQFRVALPMVEALLLSLKSVQGLEGRITAEFLDETDCVGAWQSEKLSAVLFPTAETIPSLQRIDDALSGRRLSLIINPQWQLNGQVVSDFGFGNQRIQSEKFINSLEYVYCLERIRIMGDEVRVLRCYPGKWQVYWMGSSAKESKLLAVEENKPAYDRLVELLKSDRDTRASKSWFDRFLDRRNFDQIATYSDKQSKSTQEDETSLPLPESESINSKRDIVTGEILADS